MVVGLCCNGKKHKILWQLEEYNVLKIISNMAAKKEIGMWDGFEGLLKYYVKLTPTQIKE